MYQEKMDIARTAMKQEEINTAYNALIANIITVGGVALLFTGTVLATILAFQAYQKVLR